MDKRFRDVLADEQVTGEEAELLAECLRLIRSENHIGVPRRSVSYSEVLGALCEQAYQLRLANMTHGVSSSTVADCFDGAANIVLAVAHDVNRGKEAVTRFAQRSKSVRAKARAC